MYAILIYLYASAPSFHDHMMALEIHCVNNEVKMTDKAIS